jgi:hypothetical protein
MAASALATTQEYVEAGRAKLQGLGSATNGHSDGINDALRQAANTALGVTTNVIASAQSAFSSASETASHTDRPPLENAMNTGTPHGQQGTKGSKAPTAEGTIQPHHDAIAETAQPHVNTARENPGATSSDQSGGGKVEVGTFSGIDSDSQRGPGPRNHRS